MRGLVAVAPLLLIILCGISLGAEDTVDVFTVGDSTGDWGYPSPYGHYARGPGYIRMSMIFDTLVWKDQNGYVPALAEKWEMEGDDAYIFNLRRNVTWNDGEKFTAEDVVFTFDYIKQYPYQWVDSRPVKKVEALDDYKVKISLNHTYAPFLDIIAGTMPILPKHIYKDVSNPWEFWDDKALVGTGPYRLVNYDKAQGTYLYQAYDGYYQGAPKVKQLKFVKVSDDMAAAALRKGDVDAAGVPPELAQDLKKEGFVVLESTQDMLCKLAINHKKEPFSNVSFRMALAYAIDRQSLVDSVLRGFGVPASPGLYSPQSEWYNPKADQYAYDPQKAEELLEEMGYKKDGQFFTKDGKILEVELLVDTSSERAGDLISQQLEKAGIKVDLRSVEYKTLDSLVGEWKFDLALMSLGGMGGDPQALNGIIGMGWSFASARYLEDERLNQLLSAQVLELNEEKRKALIDEIQVIYAKDLPAIPLYYSTSYWAYDGKVDLFYSKRGIANGIPIALNKISFVKG